jgi:hypothetical protein
MLDLKQSAMPLLQTLVGDVWVTMKNDEEGKKAESQRWANCTDTYRPARAVCLPIRELGQSLNTMRAWFLIGQGMLWLWLYSSG